MGAQGGGYGVSCPVRRRWPALPPHHDLAAAGFATSSDLAGGWMQGETAPSPPTSPPPLAPPRRASQSTKPDERRPASTRVAIARLLRRARGRSDRFGKRGQGRAWDSLVELMGPACRTGILIRLLMEGPAAGFRSRPGKESRTARARGCLMEAPGTRGYWWTEWSSRAAYDACNRARDLPARPPPPHRAPPGRSPTPILLARAGRPQPRPWTIAHNEGRHGPHMD